MYSFFKKIFFAVSIVYVSYGFALTPFDPCTVYDYIVIGTGPGGAVIANRLTEDPNIKVLVIEAGRDDPRLDPLLPVDLPDPLPNKRVNPWTPLSRLGPIATIGHEARCGFESWQWVALFRDDPLSRGIFGLKGSAWGGSTIHNGGAALRGSPQIYDQWGALGPEFAPIWGWNANVLKHFIKLENRSQIRASVDTADPNTPFYDSSRPAHSLGSFDPTVEGKSGPVYLLFPDAIIGTSGIPDDFALAIQAAAQLPGIYPTAPLGFKINYDLTNPPGGDETGLTNLDETAYDQYGSLFPSINPYLDSAIWPTSYNILQPPFNIGGTVARWQRLTSATAYIYPIQNRSNLTILSESLVTKVLFNSEKQAVAVEYLEGWNIYQTGRQMDTSSAGIGGTPTDAAANAKEAFRNGLKIARASREIIVSGGVFNSPQILMLSGIGPRDVLENFGINVISDLPGVGQHLGDHPELDLIWSTTAPISSLLLAIELQYPQSIAALTFKSSLDQPIPDFHCHVLPTGALTRSGLGDVLNAVEPIGPLQTPGNARYGGPPLNIYSNSDLFDPVSGVTYTRQIFDPPLSVLNHGYILFEQLAHIRSEGFVTLVSADPTVPPKVVMNYFTDTQGPGGTSQDFADYALAFSTTVVPFVESLAAFGFFSGWVQPTLDQFTTAGIFDPIKFRTYVDKNVWGHHHTGTCKMGPKSDPLAVLDARARVYGVERLRVCDASIFPISPNANPQMAVYMVGEVIADLIKEDRASIPTNSSIDPFLDGLIGVFN